jgi:hypothetical protein
MAEIITVYVSDVEEKLGFEPDTIETLTSGESLLDFDEIDLHDLYMLVCQDCKKQIPLDIVEFTYFESQVGNEDDFVCEGCADVRIFSEFDSNTMSH